MKPRNTTSSFSIREKIRRNGFNKLSKRSISLRCLCLSRSYSRGSPPAFATAAPLDHTSGPMPVVESRPLGKRSPLSNWDYLSVDRADSAAYALPGHRGLS